LSIFGPGIANCLIAGGPQLGVGAAVGTGLAVAGIGAVGVGLAGAGVGAISTAGGLAAGAARGGASLAGAATTAYRGGGMSGMAQGRAFRLDLRPRRQDHADRRRCPRRMPRPRLAGGVQRRLKFDVQRAGSDATAVHRAQHLNVTDGIEAEARRRRVEGSGPGG